MKTRLLLALAVLTAIFTIVSCDEKNYESYPPTWKGFQITPNPVTPGEKVTVVAIQNEKGRLINATDYDWTLIVELEPEGRDTIKRHEHTNYDGISNADPRMTFTIPANAKSNRQAKLTFNAVYQYSGHGIQVSSGNSYDTGSSYTGSINSTSGSLVGEARGSANITIK